MRCSCGQDNTLWTAECSRCQRALFLGMDPRRLLLDAVAAASLLVALGLVFLWNSGRASGPSDQAPDGGSGVTVEVVDERQPPAVPLRIAVTPPVYDDMGRLLDTLGAGYRHTTIEFDDLLDVQRLRAFDVVFVTCGYVPDHWVGERMREAGREGVGMYPVRPRITRQLQRSLRAYVAGGGTLYVSDLLFHLVALVFPETIDRAKLAAGAAQTIEAEVADPGLQRHLGQKTISLHFDKPSWQPAAFAGPEVVTLLEGTYQTADDPAQRLRAPLLVRFSRQDGTVIFTSFHNEKQNTGLEQRLLRYLVFATVTAQTDAAVQRTMVRGGFSPVDRSLLSASPKDQSVTRVYENPAMRDLQLVLGFASRGAQLRLEVFGPDGRRAEGSGSATFTVDIPQAASGRWEYTVTPIEVPHENFPFTLTIGEKR